MSPTNANPSTPVARSRLKSRRKSGLGVKDVKDSPSIKLCDPTNRLKLNHEESPPKRQKLMNVVKDSTEYIKDSSPSNFYNYGGYMDSPVHIPNSQAPIPGREVYWDLDTPESKRTREEFVKELEAMEESPTKFSDVSTPKMTFVKKKRTEPVTSREDSAKADQMLKDLLDFSKGIQTRVEEEEAKDKEVKHLSNQNNNIKLEKTPEKNFKLEKSPEKRSEATDDMDMFDDGFNDDDDDLLLQATQAVEDEIVGDVKRNDSEDETKFSFQTNSTVPLENPSVTSCRNDGFDDFDDSFDNFLSQVDTPTIQKENKKPIISSSSKTKGSDKSSLSKAKTNVPVHPRVSVCKNDGFESGNDSFDDLLSQIEIPTTSAIKTFDQKSKSKNLETSPVLKKPRIIVEAKTSSKTTSIVSSSSSSLLSTKRVANETKPSSKPSTVTSGALVSEATTNQKVKVGGFQFKASTSIMASSSSSHSLHQTTSIKVGGGGSVRKFSSFDSPPKEKKLIAKFRSDSYITETQKKIMCSKEEIERKKREALERRKVSMSREEKLE